MKQLFLVLFALLTSICINAQKDVAFINQELKNLELKLVRENESLKLTNHQIALLTQIFDEKSHRIAIIKRQNSQKDAISSALVNLDSELNPRITAILNMEQRLALVQRGRRSN